LLLERVAQVTPPRARGTGWKTLVLDSEVKQPGDTVMAATKQKKRKVGKVMREYKKGTLKSGAGGKGGKVKSRKQAVAIAMSESGQSRKTATRKKSTRAATSRKPAARKPAARKTAARKRSTTAARKKRV
jgi:hypothetical protein